jgi:hypothetical protein
VTQICGGTASADYALQQILCSAMCGVHRDYYVPPEDTSMGIKSADLGEHGSVSSYPSSRQGSVLKLSDHETLIFLWMLLHSLNFVCTTSQTSAQHIVRRRLEWCWTLRGPFTINHVAQKCVVQHKFAQNMIPFTLPRGCTILVEFCVRWCSSRIYWIWLLKPVLLLYWH